MKRLIILIAAVIAFTPLYAVSFESLRAVATPDGAQLGDGTFIEGVIISDFRSQNMEQNLNVTADSVDVSINARTAYIQSEDGRYGFRLKFNTPQDNRLVYATRVRLNLALCTVTVNHDPDRYTIYGVGSEDVIVLEENVTLPIKEKYVSELSDEDIYTRVSLKDVEFLAKHGSYCNIYERCAPKSYFSEYVYPKHDIPATTGAMDGWGQLMLDSQGNHIYMMVNSLCQWRRNISRVPQGVGPLHGVLVHPEQRRYGDMGRYAVRPVGVQDVVLAEESSSSYQTICEWNWNRNKYMGLNFRDYGLRKCIDSSGEAGDAVLADLGLGQLYMQSMDKLSVITEFDARHCDDAKGTGGRSCAALRVNSRTSSWYGIGNDGKAVPVNGVVASFSTADVVGNGLTVCFSFAAGIVNTASEGFPVFWTVQYSLDDKTWKAAEGKPAELHPLQYSVEGGVIADAAMGYTEHAFYLPAECVGKQELKIRLVPASDVVSSKPAAPDEYYASSVYDGSNDKKFTLGLGMLSVKVLK